MVAYTQTACQSERGAGTDQLVNNDLAPQTAAPTERGTGEAVAVETLPWPQTATVTPTEPAATVDRSPLGHVQTTANPTTRSNGYIIPTGNFRAVEVHIEDTKGRPITDAEWIQSAGLFPTAARVTEDVEGRMTARLWLLDAKYDEFIILADADRGDVDYVWYQYSDNGDGIKPSDREKTLQFERNPISGLYVGAGTDFGGMLG